MGLAAEKIIQGSTEEVQTAMGMILSSVVIRSLCPSLGSEIGFRDNYTIEDHDIYDEWIQEHIYGDLRGKIAFGCHSYTLKNLVNGLQKAGKIQSSNPEEAIKYLFNQFCLTLKVHLAEDEFRCDVSAKGKLMQNVNYRPSDQRHIVCPIESKFGAIKVLFELDFDSCQLILKQYGIHEDNGMRRIRVNSAQLDNIYERMDRIEALEQNLLQGPEIRAEIRSEVKRIKRTIQHIRKEPIELLFSPAKRLVMDISKNQGKQIRMSTEGTWLHFDKNLLNYLYSPVLHLIRNAVDHGIEPPLERERLGKPAQGYIKALAAFSPEGLRLVISDDGRGLDFSKIRSQVLSKGILTEVEANSKSPADLVKYIFEPGFSTRSKADSISGRGLGLDVVRSEIEAIGGRIDLLSTSHHGTSFEILIPLTEEQTVRKMQPVQSVENAAEAERQKVFDELEIYFERLERVINGLPDLKDPAIKTAAYEAHRILSSIKGITGFVGWHWVTNFCGSFEKLTSAIASGEIKANSPSIKLVQESSAMLKMLAKQSQQENGFALIELRQLESRILQALWNIQSEDSKSKQSMNKIALQSTKTLVQSSGEKFQSKKVTQFEVAMNKQFGFVLQFEGDKLGYLSVLFDEPGFNNLVAKQIDGASSELPPQTQLWAVSQLAERLGRQFVSDSHEAGIELNVSAPMTFEGSALALEALGVPTFCFECQIEGETVYLIGDLRAPYQPSLPIKRVTKLTPNPEALTEELKNIGDSLLKSRSVQCEAEESQTQSDRIGFEQGLTGVVPLTGSEFDIILFLSIEATLGHQIQSLTKTQNDIFEMTRELSIELAQETQRKCQNLKLNDQSASIYLGRFYIPSYQRLYLNKKITLKHESGRCELQFLIVKN